MIPSLNLGIAILTNQESTTAFEAIASHIIDAYLGRAADRLDRRLQAIEKRAASRERVVHTGRGLRARHAHPSRPWRSRSMPARIATPGTAT